MDSTMTDTMSNSDLTPGTVASVTPSSVEPRSEVDSSWGLMLVPILICVVLTLYVSLI